MEDRDRQETWIARYLEKYRPVQADLSADFLRENLVFEVVPERAFAVIEREDEFAARDVLGLRLGVIRPTSRGRVARGFR